MKTTTKSQFDCIQKVSVLTLALLAASTLATRSADIPWIGGTASYTTAANWLGGVVPGFAGNAINDNGTNNVVQINVGNPDWTVNQIRAGNGTGSGAFVQNGQTVTLFGTNVDSPAFTTPFRLGIAAGGTGVYTLNGGSINYSNGGFNVGELGTGILNINGGSITGSGNFAANLGVRGTPVAVTATMDGGPTEAGFTWFEQGFYAANTAIGLPPAGSTITSVSQADHSYTMAPSYTANDAVIIDSHLPSATITFTSPTACSALSFVSSSGHGPVTVNYTVHHADSTTETGSFISADWFAVDTLVLGTGGRVDALGLNLQTFGAGNQPRIFSQDIVVANTVSPVTSIDLSYTTGVGLACIFGVSSSSGGAFSPLAITGYNEDMIVEAAAVIHVANTVTDIVTQTAGAVNVTDGGQIFVGNIGTGIYNLSGGSVDVHNYIAFGRSSGNGTVNMTGGTLNQDGGGNILVGTGFNNNGNPALGLLNQSGGTINSQGAFFCPENAPSTGTYNLSGTGALNIQNEMVIGRGGAAGIMTMTGGTVTKTGGNNFIVGADNLSVGTLNQSAGSIDVNNETWIGQAGGASGLYNLSGGSITGHSWFVIGRNGGAGVLNLTNGSLTKVDGGNFIIADGGGSVGTLNQYGGVITNTTSGTWIGNGGNGTWNFNGGAALLGVVNIINGGGTASTLNLNGGVMTLQELKTGNTGAISILTLNGGTLRAATDSGTFLHDITIVNVSSPGGAIFDSQSYNITVAQAMPNNGGDGSGGLTKNGAGTLTLTGANSYAGPTLVNAGTLFVTTDATGAGDFTVAGGAQLSVKVQSYNAQLNAANATFASSAPLLGIDLGAFGNPATAPLNVAGTLAVNGTVAISLADALPQLGQFPLIKYGAKTGAGSFVLGALPVGVVGSISNNVLNSSIDLVITTVNLPRWEGLAGGNWDIGVTTNWLNIGDGLPTFYGQGNAVAFNDSATGTTTVNLGTTVTPSAITINNNSLLYSLVGTGKISGSTGLSKQGTNSASILNTGGNNFTGPVTISGGTLTVSNLANGGSPSAIGASTASPTNLVLAGGTLSYAGPNIAINRGYSLRTTGGSAIDTEANLTLSGLVTAGAGSGFTKTGSAQLAYIGVGNSALAGGNYLVRNGSVVFDGSAGAQTNTVSGTFSVGGVVNAVATLTNATLNDNDNAVGNVPGSIGSMTVNSNSTLNVNSWFTLGDAANSVSTFNLNGGTVNVPNGRIFLCSAPGTLATLNINGGVINKNSGDITCIADGGWNGSGTRTGFVNQVAGTCNFNTEMQIGQTALGTAVYNLHGGAINSSGWFVIGRSGGFGTFNMDGGILNHTSGGQPAFVVGSGAGNNGLASVGVLNQSAGTINCTSEYWLAENNGTQSTNNISGTAVVNVGNWVSFGRGGHAVVNFSGGTITKTGGGNFIIGDGGNAYFNQTGGAMTINSQFWIGQAGSGVGQYDLSAGTVSVDDWVAVGRQGATGTLNISGGSLTKVGNSGNHLTIGSGGPGTINQTGGTITSTQSDTYIGESSQPSIWNMNGGLAVLSVVYLPINNGANGTLNLNGGTFNASEVVATNTSGTGTLNFNGGTLGATTSNTNFLHGLTTANVQSAGAVINSGTNVISIAQPLLDGTGGGGLTKIGNGTLYLNGANTYTGSTLVSTGALGGKGVIAGPVSVASGAALAPGTASIGTLTINNTLNLAAGSKTTVKISLNGGVTNSDQVVGLTGITYAGSLVVNNVGTNALTVGSVFNLFTVSGPISGNYSQVSILPFGTGTFNPSTGRLTITSEAPPTVNPPVVSGGNLILSGTGGNPGGAYTWLTTTNLVTPIALWTISTNGVYSATGSFTNAIPINNSLPTQFFRFRTP